MLFSIGYATKALATFLAQLRAHRIDAVADVRSVPFSRVFHDYHQDRLQRSLKAAQIHYVYLGKELGPRSPDSAHYDESGQVQFDRLRQSEPFHQGIERLQTGLQKGMRIALLCAEKDPAICHRSLLIGQHLWQESGLNVGHITHDGKIEQHSQLLERLVEEHGLLNDLLTNNDEKRELAFEERRRQTSYRRPD